MSTNNEILINTLEKRRLTFFKLLDDANLELEPTVIDGIEFDPLRVTKSSNGCRNLSVTLPLLKNRLSYGFKFKGKYRCIVRGKETNCYYLVHHSNEINLQDTWRDSFIESTQFSMLFYAVFTWIKELKSTYRVKINDEVFHPLLEDMSDDNPELIINFILNQTNVEHSKDSIWISLFD